MIIKIIITDAAQNELDSFCQAYADVGDAAVRADCLISKHPYAAHAYLYDPDHVLLDRIDR